MINITNLSFNYKKKIDVLTNINFNIKKGDFIIICGSNGSGKTTLIKLILNYLKPYKYDFQNKYEISYIPDKFYPDLDISIKEFLNDIRLVKNVEEDYFNVLYNLYIDMFDLKDKENYSLKELSNGMKQKVNIISALINNFDILIVDEILNGLDKNMREIVVDILKTLHKNNRTIILVTHYIDLFLNIKTKVLNFDKIN